VILDFQKLSDGGRQAVLWMGEPFASPTIKATLCPPASRGLRVRLAFDGEDNGLRLSASTPLAYAALSALHVVPRRVRDRAFEWAESTHARGRSRLSPYDLDPFEREIASVSVDPDGVSVGIWRGESWSFDDHHDWPWYTNGVHLRADLRELLFGRLLYHEQETDAVSVKVVLPEGSYAAKVVLARVAWRRERSPFALRWQWRAKIEVDGGVPVPGKGTEAWNVEEDAIFGTTFPVQEGVPFAAAVANAFARSILDRRQRYASLAWTPAEGWPAHCEVRQ